MSYWGGKFIKQLENWRADEASMKTNVKENLGGDSVTERVNQHTTALKNAQENLNVNPIGSGKLGKKTENDDVEKPMLIKYRNKTTKVIFIHHSDTKTNPCFEVSSVDS